MLEELFNFNRTYRKAYKYGHNGNYSMLPGNLNWLPDDSYNSLNLMNQRNAYKLVISSYFRMFPSDLFGSLDVFFLTLYFKFGVKF